MNGGAPVQLYKATYSSVPVYEVRPSCLSWQGYATRPTVDFALSLLSLTPLALCGTQFPCQGVAVMRRKSDGWLNATQILKVAGFDKPQRTRVLEREVQKGTHEKVQGGYGKYQGE